MIQALGILRFTLAVLLTCVVTVASNEARANSSEEFEVRPFLTETYTGGFSLGLIGSLSFSERVGSGSLDGRLDYRQEPGQPLRRFNRDWIGVKTVGEMRIGSEESKLFQLDLYDPKTKLLAYAIDLDDGSVTSYETSVLPLKIKPGVSPILGSLIKKSKEGEVLETGVFQWEFVISAVGFEFCQIETAQELKSRVETTVRTCDIFDKRKRIVGQRVDLSDSEGTKFSWSGPVRLR